MLETVLHATTRWDLPRLELSSKVQIGSHEWQPLAYTGADGALHRIITVDRWTDTDLAREGHSWFIAGDVAATGKAMTIHVIEIGQVRDGRRASPWARGWRHPTFSNVRMRFARKDGGDFEKWNKVYFTDGPQNGAEWVEGMYRDGVAQNLVKHIAVDAEPRGPILEQIFIEAHRAEKLLTERKNASWCTAPMSRGACDGFVPCPWQVACYENVTEPALTGLYVRKGESMLRVA